jgi:hypothetical protein
MGTPRTLNAVKGGINRLRTKGGPSPNDLFDALNCYIDASGCPTSRDGTTVEYQLPEGTKGMAAANGVLVVFSHEVVGPMPSGVTLEVISNPNNPADPIAEIHFAGPFLADASGAILYVVAEFASGDVFHYWLQHGSTWQANHAYGLGDIVIPTTPNGLVYRAERLNPAKPVWQPNVTRAVGQIVEATTFDGNQYEVVATIGTNPRSGATEPAWNTPSGALTYEDVDLTPASSGETGSTTSPDTPSTDVRDRYNNPGGNRPGQQVE